MSNKSNATRRRAPKSRMRVRSRDGKKMTALGWMITETATARGYIIDDTAIMNLSRMIAHGAMENKSAIHICVDFLRAYERSIGFDYNAAHSIAARP